MRKSTIIISNQTGIVNKKTRVHIYIKKNMITNFTVKFCSIVIMCNLVVQNVHFLQTVEKSRITGYHIFRKEKVFFFRVIIYIAASPKRESTEKIGAFFYFAKILFAS